MTTKKFNISDALGDLAPVSATSTEDGPAPGTVSVLPEPARSVAAEEPRPDYVRQEEALRRKETYIWPDQRESLYHVARRLEDARPRAMGDRITENTLIRVAIDLLMERAEELAGCTEEQIRQSLRRRPRDPMSHRPTESVTR